MNNAGTRGRPLVTLSNKARRRKAKKELEYPILFNFPSAKAFFLFMQKDTTEKATLKMGYSFGN